MPLSVIMSWRISVTIFTHNGGFIRRSCSTQGIGSRGLCINFTTKTSFGMLLTYQNICSTLHQTNICRPDQPDCQPDGSQKKEVLWMKPVCSDKQARGAAPAERSGHMTGNQIGEKIQSHIWFHCFGKIKQLLEEMDPPVLALWRT